MESVASDRETKAQRVHIGQKKDTQGMRLSFLCVSAYFFPLFFVQAFRCDEVLCLTFFLLLSSCEPLTH